MSSFLSWKARGLGLWTGSGIRLNFRLTLTATDPSSTNVTFFDIALEIGPPICWVGWEASEMHHWTWSWRKFHPEGLPMAHHHVRVLVWRYYHSVTSALTYQKGMRWWYLAAMGGCAYHRDLELEVYGKPFWMLCWNLHKLQGQHGVASYQE